MRYLLSLGFLGLTWLSLAQAQSPAQQAYLAQDRGQHQRAIELYDSLLVAGFSSVDIHFNLANAHYQREDMGQAMLHYEKAFRLAPYDQQVQTNLRLLRNEQKDGLLPLPTFFLKAWAQSLAARMSDSSWAILAIVLAFASITVFMGYLWSWWPTYRKWMPLLIAMTLGLSVLFLVLGGVRQAALNKSDLGILLSPQVVMHNAPADDAETSDTIHAGLRVRILDTFEGWTKIQLVDGREGWVPAAAMGII